MPLSDTVPARFMDLRERSSDWKLNCPTHGDVNMIILFNGDFKNRAYCQDCFEVEVARLSKKVTFRANGGPEPEAVSSTAARP